MITLKIINDALTFDDVLLVPGYSNVLPKTTVLHTRLTKNISLKIPVLSSAMDTVTEHKMAIAMAQAGGIGFIHKNLSPETQAHMITLVKKTEALSDASTDHEGRLLCGAAIGVSDDSMDRLNVLVDAGVDVITVDSAHGHSEGVIEMVRKIRAAYPTLNIIAGNIVTEAAAHALIEAGADALKVGVGPGSICTTRIVAGIGMPQITAVMNVYKAAKQHNIPVIADGGIKYSGDIAKAIAAGAESVMLGSLLAGCDESPGEIIIDEGRKYKTYQGMGSLASMKRGSSDRYFQSHNKTDKKMVPEGIEGRVPYKGAANDVLYQLTGGLRSSMGYCGTKTILQLRDNAQFVKISLAGYTESHPHTIEQTKAAPNYKK